MNLPAVLHQELQAPVGWTCIEFISDLHLHPSDPATFGAWQDYLTRTAASAVFILGDLFEVWAGDDVTELAGFESTCLHLLAHATGQRPVFFMHGNRDFLVGAAFCRQTQVQLLPDPTLLCFGGHRVLLSHGDALCLDDVEYQRFRAEVRADAWQREFLAKPLQDRLAIARHIRQISADKKHGGMGEPGFDLDTAAVTQWLTLANASTLLHGHTHRPATHDLGQGRQRVVLSDWDAAAQPPRAQVLRWQLPPASERSPLPRFERIDIA